jgi:hypothetical protein
MELFQHQISQFVVQIYKETILSYLKSTVYTCVNAKTRSVETIPGIGGRGIKESSGGGEFKYDIFYSL